MLFVRVFGDFLQLFYELFQVQLNHPLQVKLLVRSHLEPEQVRDQDPVSELHPRGDEHLYQWDLLLELQNIFLNFVQNLQWPLVLGLSLLLLAALPLLKVDKELGLKLIGLLGH